MTKLPLPVDFIERLKAANPIEEVMGSYVSLRRSGRDFVCLCPFHNEKTPSCYIHPDKEYFHCFGCNAGGDVITFTMKYNNLDYMEAVRFLAERGGVPMPEDTFFGGQRQDTRKRLYEMNRTAAKFFFEQLKSPEGKACLYYLMRVRRLSQETIKKYRMGFAPNSWSALKRYMMSEGYTEEELIQGSLISPSKDNSKKPFDFFVNRAMFPFYDLSGHIVGFGGRALSNDDKRKYLNSRETLVYNKDRYLFSMNFAKNACVKNRQILLCEGNLDVISLNQAGFENAVASCGTALTPQQVKIISNYADSVVICYDSDEAGQKATKRAIRLISETGLKTTVLHMEGAKDPDEYINKFGVDHFNHLIRESKDAVTYRLDECKSKVDMDSEEGKYEYLRESCKVLMELPSAAQRELYFARLEKETGLNRTSIESELDGLRRRTVRAESKREWNRIVTGTNERRDPINPEALHHKKQAKAEEGIIYYIYKNRDACEWISDKLPAESFVTEFNKRLYQSLITKIKADLDSSVSSFNDEFSPDEVGKLTEMIDKCEQLGIDEAVIEDYINVLLSFHQEKAPESDSDDDFMSMIDSLRKKKKH